MNLEALTYTSKPHETVEAAMLELRGIVNRNLADAQMLVTLNGTLWNVESCSHNVTAVSVPGTGRRQPATRYVASTLIVVTHQLDPPEDDG